MFTFARQVADVPISAAEGEEVDGALVVSNCQVLFEIVTGVGHNHFRGDSHPVVLFLVAILIPLPAVAALIETYVPVGQADAELLRPIEEHNTRAPSATDLKGWCNRLESVSTPLSDCAVLGTCDLDPVFAVLAC